MDDIQDNISGITLTGAQGSSDVFHAQTTTGTSTIWTIGSGGGSGGIGVSYPNVAWNSTGTTTFNNNSVIRPGGQLELSGEDADILINGESLRDTLQSIQDRLNILRPNPELEQQWDQLRELGEAYRRLEAELEEKQRMWDTLKKMPAPKTK